jgi:TP901 family phage tail tape measure protein
MPGVAEMISLASSAGASIEQVAAMAGLLGNVGIQGSMAGTALRAAFLRSSTTGHRGSILQRIAKHLQRGIGRSERGRKHITHTTHLIGF